jgi:hypothetical protein
VTLASAAPVLRSALAGNLDAPFALNPAFRAAVAQLIVGRLNKGIPAKSNVHQ